MQINSSLNQTPMDNASKTKDFFVVLVVELLFFAHKITSFVPLFYAGTLMLFLVMFVSKSSKLLLYMVAFLPSSGIMKIPNLGAAILGYIFFFCAIKELISRKSSVKADYLLILLVLSLLITSLINYNISYFFSFIRFFVLILFVFDYFSDENKGMYFKRQGIDYFLYGTIINIILGIVFCLFRHVSIFNGGFEGISLDRNYYSSVVSLAVAFSTFNFFTSKKTVFSFLIVIFLIFGGLLSGSRTFFVSLSVPVLIILCFCFRPKRFNKFLFLIIISVIAIAILREEIFSLLDTTLKRFNNSTASSGGMRFEAWIYYLNIALYSPFTLLFGYSSSFPVYGIQVNQWDYDGTIIVQHNTFIQSINEIGLIGSLFLLLTLFRMFNIISSKKRRLWFYLLPVVSVCICYFFINALFADVLTISLVLCFSFFDYRFLREKSYESFTN